MVCTLRFFIGLRLALEHDFRFETASSQNTNHIGAGAMSRTRALTEMIRSKRKIRRGR